MTPSSVTNKSLLDETVFERVNVVVEPFAVNSSTVLSAMSKLAATSPALRMPPHVRQQSAMRRLCLKLSLCPCSYFDPSRGPSSGSPPGKECSFVLGFV